MGGARQGDTVCGGCRGTGRSIVEQMGRVTDAGAGCEVTDGGRGGQRSQAHCAAPQGQQGLGPGACRAARAALRGSENRAGRQRRGSWQCCLGRGSITTKGNK